MKNHSKKKILVVSLPGIGDTINCTPIFEPLARTFPEAHLTALVMYGPCKEVLETNPYIDEVILWEFLKKGFVASLGFLSKMRRRRFDISIMCYPANRIEYNVVSFAIGARIRLGHRYTHQNARNLFFLNNRTVMEKQQLHNVEENLRLLELIGAEVWEEDRELSLPLNEEDSLYASRFLDELPRHKILIGMHAWSTTLKNMHRKCWSPLNFALLADRLKAEYECEILLFQGPHDAATNKDIVRKSRSTLNLVQGTTVRESAAIMKKCDIFITNDSGPMHMAAAAGVPIVAIFGPTDPVRLHPWSKGYRIVRTGIDCSPCFYYSPSPLDCRRGDYVCLEDIDVGMVHGAAKEILDGIALRKRTEPRSSS